MGSGAFGRWGRMSDPDSVGSGRAHDGTSAPTEYDRAREGASEIPERSTAFGAMLAADCVCR